MELKTSHTFTAIGPQLMKSSSNEKIFSVLISAAFILRFLICYITGASLTSRPLIRISRLCVNCVSEFRGKRT